MLTALFWGAVGAITYKFKEPIGNFMADLFEEKK